MWQLHRYSSLFGDQVFVVKRQRRMSLKELLNITLLLIRYLQKEHYSIFVQLVNPHWYNIGWWVLFVKVIIVYVLCIEFTIIISGSGTILLSNAIIPITYIAPPPSSSSSSSTAEEEDAQESQQILSLYRQSPSLNRDFISCNWRRRSPLLVFCCCS